MILPGPAPCRSPSMQASALHTTMLAYLFFPSHAPSRHLIALSPTDGRAAMSRRIRPLDSYRFRHECWPYWAALERRHYVIRISRQKPTTSLSSLIIRIITRVDKKHRRAKVTTTESFIWIGHSAGYGQLVIAVKAQWNIDVYYYTARSISRHYIMHADAAIAVPHVL